LTRASSKARLSNAAPMLIVAVIALILSVPIMIFANYVPAQRALERGTNVDCDTPLSCAFNLRSPVVPAPAQFIRGFANLNWPIADTRNVPYNAGVTALATVAGLALAACVGLAFAVLLVVSRGFEQAMLPWLIASQTVPVIAIAPMLAVVLGSNGVQGWVPKVLIAAYIAFFPISIGVAKGLRSPDALSLDLMKTYNATDAQTYSKLRFPSSLPYLFTAFKVSMAAALIGAIVAEMSTVGSVGLGVMLAEFSKTSDAVAPWVVMVGSAVVGIGLVGLVGLAERLVTPWRREA
jgi:NitT/TauT family transport system permease protein